MCGGHYRDVTPELDIQAENTPPLKYCKNNNIESK
jgi:hypothetical protein